MVKYGLPESFDTEVCGNAPGCFGGKARASGKVLNLRLCGLGELLPHEGLELLRRLVGEGLCFVSVVRPPQG